MTESSRADSAATSMPREITVADPDASFFAPVKGSLFGIISLGVIGAVSSVVPFIAMKPPG